MSLITIESLDKRFGDTVALRDISFEVEEGEFVSILGPSGSGKTTLLNLISGFEQPDSGQIIVDGEVLGDKPPEDRDMSLIFQRLALFPHMNVFDNIAFGLRLKLDLSEAEIEERVADILELVDLAGFEDRKIQSLSGGEQQRVALCRAIVVEPKLILYDEPLSDLDRQLREQMRREIKQLHERLGITSIYVTHNQREALTLSNRIVVLSDGELVRYDTPERIYEDPQSRFVANFVGESNFIPGSIESREGRPVFVNDTLTLPLEGVDPNDGTGSLYVRPEDITLDGSRSDSRTFDGEIVDSVHLGSTAEYVIDVDGQTFRVTELGQPRYEPGDDIRVTLEDYGLVEG